MGFVPVSKSRHGLGILGVTSNGFYLVGDNKGWCGFVAEPFHPTVELETRRLPKDHPSDFWYGIKDPEPLPLGDFTDDISPIGPTYERYRVPLKTVAFPVGTEWKHWRLGWDSYRKLWIISDPWYF